MISKKILYSEQLLQLVLALSLLQVDPINYLEWGFSRIHNNDDGSPWQLEVAHMPFSIYPYMGRKHFVPLIEDLGRVGGYNDVQAYLLNVSDGPQNLTDNASEEQQNQATTPYNVNISSSSQQNLNLIQNSHDTIIDEIFFNNEHVETASIIDQNLADLNDYEDHSHNLDVKNGIFDPWDDLLNRPFRNVDRPGSLNADRDALSWINEPSSFVSDELPERIFQQDSNETKEKAESTKIKSDDDVDELSNVSDVELTPEEMDLIEVLWKQDVDLGYNPPLPSNNPSSTQKEAKVEDDIERLETLLELKDDKKFDKDASNPWNGLPYTIDTETGEYILQKSTNDTSNEDLNNLLLDDALQFVIEADIVTKEVEEKSKTGEEEEEDLESVLINNLKFNGEDGEFDLSSPLSNLFDESEDLNILNNDMMIQSSSTHFQHPRQPSQNYAHCVNGYRQNSYQGRVPLARSTMSMEQRWQDLANLLSFPPAMSMSDMSSHAAAHHYSPHYGYQTHPAVLHNASLADIVSQPNSSHHLQPYSGSNINLGSAVASSMHLTNSTSETDAGNSSYKMDHDMLYYSHPNPNELNHTSDGFLNILNDDDLLMDIAVNEGMYTMRMLDQNGTNASNAAANPHLNNTILGNHLPTNLSSGLGSMAVSTNATGNNDRLDASSDSAVSSMGSERVASLSDGEWNEAGSDSAQEYNVRKFSSPYDYRFNRAMVSNRQPVAQKKHQMYGKRFAHEPAILHQPPSVHPHSSVVPPELASNTPMKFEPYDGFTNIENPVGASSSSQAILKPSTSTNTSEIKYSYAIDFPHRQVKAGNSVPSTQETISHNHTYSLHPHNAQIMNNNGANPRPQARDKKTKKSEDEHMTRDEKRARALQIPITVMDIINLPMDEFNERLSKYDLSENQLSLIRDIRRRGKNKVAAQNCRKRKLDQIISLSDEVKEMKMRKDRFLREHDMLLTERRRIKDKFSLLYRHVFNNLRDSEGNSYSSYQYSLQQSADGSVVLVPRSASDQNSENPTNGSGASSSSRHNGQQHSGNNNTTNFK